MKVVTILDPKRRIMNDQLMRISLQGGGVLVRRLVEMDVHSLEGLKERSLKAKRL